MTNLTSVGVTGNQGPHRARQQAPCGRVCAQTLAVARHTRQQPRTARSPEGAARGMEDHTLTRILVVEDDEFMAQALVSMLQTIAETNTASGAELCLQVPSHP